MIKITRPTIPLDIVAPFPWQQVTHAVPAGAAQLAAEAWPAFKVKTIMASQRRHSLRSSKFWDLPDQLLLFRRSPAEVSLTP